MNSRVPVTVLTGFLGSGKTTLLNRILTENHGQRIAVIENEFGEIGVDQDLVIRSDEEIFEMNNGCICCTVRGDLIRILGNLMKRRDKFDRILIETTGMADPGPVAQTFFVDDEVREELSLDGVVTLVDAKHLEQHLDSSDEVRSQIAFADVILLNKIDLVTPEQADAIEARLHAMNGMAKIRRVSMGAAAMSDILDLGGFDLDRALAVKPTFLDPEYPFEWAGVIRIPAEGAVLSLAEGPDPEMDCVLMPWVGGSAVPLRELAERVFPKFSGDASTVASGGVVPADGTLCRLVLTDSGTKSFRISAGAGGDCALFTQHLPEEFSLAVRTPAGEPIAPMTETRFAAAHEHDDTVSSVGVEFAGAVDGKKINEWLSRLLQTQGADIFRMKGLLNIAGEKDRFVFQGVHMLFDGQPGGPWGNQTPTNRLVFIGRNLDRQELESGFRACLVHR